MRKSWMQTKSHATYQRTISHYCIILKYVSKTICLATQTPQLVGVWLNPVSGRVPYQMFFTSQAELLLVRCPWWHSSVLWSENYICLFLGGRFLSWATCPFCLGRQKTGVLVVLLPFWKQTNLNLLRVDGRGHSSTSEGASRFQVDGPSWSNKHLQGWPHEWDTYNYVKKDIYVYLLIFYTIYNAQVNFHDFMVIQIRSYRPICQWLRPAEDFLPVRTFPFRRVFPFPKRTQLKTNQHLIMSFRLNRTY